MKFHRATQLRARAWLRRPLAWASASAACLMLSSCFLDENRCDAYQVPLHGDLTVCECAPGTIRDPRGYGCKPCGDNEVVNDNKCVCESGFARTTPDSACEASMLGAACSDAMPCGPAFPYCASDRSAGYCTTQGCTAASDCAEGWACVTATPMSYCSKPPSGQGSPCATDDSCKDFEASYCEAVVSKTCLVRDCATGENSCFSGYTCCDLSKATGGSVPSLCVPPAALMGGGACPLNAPKVEP